MICLILMPALAGAVGVLVGFGLFFYLDNLRYQAP